MRRQFSSSWPLTPSTSLECLWDDFSRFLSQKMHHLSFAVKAHDPAGHLLCVLEGSRADNFFHLRDIGAVHAEDVQAQSQEKQSVQRIAAHFTTDADADGVSLTGADRITH